jgi:hypothetical protein
MKGASITAAQTEARSKKEGDSYIMRGAYSAAAAVEGSKENTN